MASRSTNTMVEMLQRFLADISQAKAAMDADLPFLMQLESMVLSKLREPVVQMQQQGLLPNDQQMMMQQMGGGGAPAPAGPLMPMPQQGGLMPAPAAPNMDEMRRLLGG